MGTKKEVSGKGRFLLVLANLSGPIGIGGIWLPGAIWKASQGGSFMESSARQATIGQTAYFLLTALLALVLDNCLESPAAVGMMLLIVFALWTVIAILAARAVWQGKEFKYPVIGYFMDF